ncbi:MAG: pyridoxal-phosphate dependent enzyme [Gaiellaceae bacterium]
MKFGILLICPALSDDPRRDLDEPLAQAIAAEELGYDSVWVTEHHSRFGVVGSPAVLLAAIAARTSRIRVGSMAAILPYHRPVRVAEDYALVDVLGGGRLELGVGRGNISSERALHGVDPAASSAVFWDALARIRELWGDGASAGRTYPRPLQQPVPIWVAANSLDTARRAAALGLRIATSPSGHDLDGYVRLVDEMREAIEAHGHDPAQLGFPLVTMNTYLAPTPEQAREEFEAPAFLMHRLMREADGKPPAEPTAAALARDARARKISLVTDPPGAVRFLRDLDASAGVGHFVASTAQGGLAHERVLASMTLFAREVMDVLRTDPAGPTDESRGAAPPLAPSRARPMSVIPRALVNPNVHPVAVVPPSGEAASFHAALAGYRPTPLRPLAEVAAELGVAEVWLKDESNRLGLPSFKILGASWAAERALLEYGGAPTLIAASAGNHGRAVAHVAALRGLGCRIFLPARSSACRRGAIAAEGAEVIVVDGGYEETVGRAAAEGALDGVVEIADVGDSGPARWVIDGDATLFAEAGTHEAFDVILVPAGVGSLAAAAARFATHAGAKVVAVEPVTAACLTASLAAGEPTSVSTPGTVMADLDCAEVSAAAWPSLRDGIHGTVTVDDDEARAAVSELAAAGLAIGESGAAPLAALRAHATEPACADLREAVGFGPDSHVLLIATEGPTAR